MYAEMREKQRAKRAAAEAGAAVIREQKRDVKKAKKAGAAVVAVLPSVVAPVVTERAVGFTWGKPLPKRSRKDLKVIRLRHRRKKHPPKPKSPPKCKCGECAECARRKRHTEYMRIRRQNGQVTN